MQKRNLIKYLIGTLLLSVFVLMGSCRKSFDTDPSDGQLRFSKDTVYLDTVFSNIGSSTYRLKIYNDNHNDITIPSIRLGQGESSHYRLNVDGIPGKVFDDIDILAKDSLFIFIETTSDIKDFGQNLNQFLYTDKIEFDSGSEQQDVQLVTLVQDAHFLYPEKFNDGSTETLTLGQDEEGNPIKISGFYLSDNELHFTKNKPYVIYGYAAVPPNKTLRIDPGARIHFHTNGGIIVANQASLHVNGQLSNNPEEMENEVIFQGDRIEPDFDERAGQWQTIWLTQGSTDNIINHATIKNATAGLKIDSNDGSPNPTLKISNTQIYNCTTVGLWATTSNIEGKNIVINNCGQAALYLTLGGKYNFYNSTFANYWSQSYRDFPTALIENKLETSDNILVSDLEEANFYNCIIYGADQMELLFSKSDQAAFNYKFENCLIRFNDFNQIFVNNPLYDFEDTDHFEQVILNEDPVFFDASKNKLIIGEDSPANGLANPSTATSTDILGNPRGNNPDSGAYESSVFSEDD